VLTSKEIRSSFIDFFKQQGHKFVPSSPIVPRGDDTLLFANAGMNQFKDVFIGSAKPRHTRAVNSQKCLRVSGKHNDLEEVGKDTYHHTFFEMLGNWSFNDYFKAETIQWAWKLLTEVWGIDGNRLWATVFAGSEEDNIGKDTEAEKLWTQLTPIRPEHVLAFGRKDNFWEMGATGPCGPCSEVHIDLGSEMCDMKDVPGHKCAVNGGCARFIELWNLVFIQYSRSESGKLSPLGAKYIDTGAGLERITAVLQGKRSNYETDLFMPIIEHLEEMTGHKYTGKLHNKTDNAFRVIADHIRALTFSITDGATPSNEGRGYVIRRILRRASRFGRELDMHEPFMYRVVPAVVEIMREAFPEIKERSDHVSTVIESEEASFGRTLDRGIEIFYSAAEQATKSRNKTITGDNAFKLYDTYGFPLDLTRLMAQERGLSVQTDKFEQLMEQQRARARAAQKDAGLQTTVDETELPATEDVQKYHTRQCQSKVLGWVGADGYSDQGQINAGDEVGLVLEKTCFYAEAGGQVGDCGTIESEKGGKFIVEQTIKMGRCVVHKGSVSEGTFRPTEPVVANVSPDREAIRKNHTATHLLQWALQKVVGASTAQQGSLVSPNYLRFDFTCPKALTDEQLDQVQQLVREKIQADEPVLWLEMDKDQAQKLGAMALFGEKYGQRVRVVALGTDNSEQLDRAFSKEFCGGTHVDRLGVIGGFKIIKEESISAGIRRITAMTGRSLVDYLEQRSDTVDQLSRKLKVPAEDLTDRVTQLVRENKKLSKEIKKASQKGGSDIMAQAKKLLKKSEKVRQSQVIVGQVSETHVEQARQAIDMLKTKASSAAVVLGFASDGKAMLLAGVTDDLIKKGLKAGDIVRQIAPIIGGGGGGRPQMAQAGGKDPAKLDEALKQAAEMIKEKLS